MEVVYVKMSGQSTLLSTKLCLYKKCKSNIQFYEFRGNPYLRRQDYIVGLRFK